MIEKVPGGMMVIPLILGAVINTLFPEALEIGGFTTALFKNGATTLIGAFLLCMGAGISIKAIIGDVVAISSLILINHSPHA